MVFHGPHEPFEAVAFPVPESLEAGEVLVRLKLAAICGSDLHTYTGRRIEPMPSILGHEGVGVVMALGGDVDRGIAIGDRVTWSLVDSCGECVYCTRHGLPQKCPEKFKYGHAHWFGGEKPNGCYATHIVLRKGTPVVRVPERVSDRMVVSANCALATMVHAVSYLGAEIGSVWIQGAGLLGIYGALLLKERGGVEVTISDVNEDRLTLARDLGLKALSSEEMRRCNGEHPEHFDAVIEVAGMKTLLSEGIDAIRHGGTYLWVGLAHPDSDLDFKGELVVRKCLTVQGVYNYAPWHLQEAVAFLERTGERIPVERFVSPAIPLRELDRAIALSLERTWLRVTLDCESS